MLHVGNRQGAEISMFHVKHLFDCLNIKKGEPSAPPGITGYYFLYLAIMAFISSQWASMSCTSLNWVRARSRFCPSR